MSQYSRKTPAPLRLSLTVLLAVTMNIPLSVLAQGANASGAEAPARPVSTVSAASQALLETPSQANAKMLGWLQTKEKKLTGWLATRDQKDNYIPNWGDFSIAPNSVPLSPMTVSEARIAANTKALYDQYFPRSEDQSFVGTFFESGNPHIDTNRGPYQWDSQKAAGLDEAGVFEAAVKSVVASGIKSIRIGPNIFEIKNGMQSWSNFMQRIDTIWENGATPTISVAFFPSLQRWKVIGADGKVDDSQSFLLNPQWPADMAAMTTDMMNLLNAKSSMFERKNHRPARFIINPINEPETLAGFNRQFWHGAHANWSSPLMMKYYVPSVINIAKANVAIRQAVENKSHGERILFMHNEAMTPTYYPSHKGPGRFAVSKFMLGDDLVVNTDFDAYLTKPLEDLKRDLLAAAAAKTMNEVEWAFKEYVFGSFNTSVAMQEQARQQLVGQFKSLKAAHKQLFASTGKTMKTDNMLWMDYYYQTEFILNRPVPKLNAQLARNGAALLKKVLDVKEDATVIRMMRTAVLEAKKQAPILNPHEMEQIQFLFEGVDLTKIDFADLPKEIAKMPEVSLAKFDVEKLMAAEDYFLFYALIGIRNEFSYAKDPVTAARRAKFKIFSSVVKRTDALLAELLVADAQKLRAVLNVKSDPQLMKVLADAAEHSRDGGEVVALSGNESLREILNKNERKILERLFGMAREQLLGFEPEHYARHLRLGIRDGFYKFAMDYINALRVHTVGVGESGTPFYVFAPILHDQVMMEYARVLKSGVYGTQYAFGPALDTKGWAKGPLSLHYADDHETNPSGMFSLVKGKRGYEVKERSFKPNETGWARTFLNDFFANLHGQ